MSKWDACIVKNWWNAFIVYNFYAIKAIFSVKIRIKTNKKHENCKIIVLFVAYINSFF